jgi:predicted anti-sigma-YlaC factor YlaD
MILKTREELACQQVVELVTGYLEGTMGRRQRRRLESHLAGCEHCTEYLHQMRETISLTGGLRVADLTPEMRGHLLELFRRWRADGG